MQLKSSLSQNEIVIPPTEFKITNKNKKLMQTAAKTVATLESPVPPPPPPPLLQFTTNVTPKPIESQPFPLVTSSSSISLLFPTKNDKELQPPTTSTLKGLPGCVLNLNFVPMAPPPITEQTTESTTEESDTDDEDEYVDPYLYVTETYGDLMEELYVKPSRWRYIYETTGKLDVKFKGCKKMGLQLEDICKSKLKFVDEAKTQLDVKNSTNNLILMYQSKKKTAVTAGTTTASNANTASATVAKQTSTTSLSNKTTTSSLSKTNNTTVTKPQANSKPTTASSKTSNTK
jgi:hypothetical protein